MADIAAMSKPSGGIQSVDLAMVILTRLAHSGRALSLSELARECDMPPSKLHKYLTSFQAAGMVVQSGRSGKYDLGASALRLGLAAMARHDFVNACSDGLPDLRDTTGMTVLLSVWGAQGATVVRWERAPSPVITSMGLGTVLPLLTSASGRVFLSWSPQEAIAERLDQELEVTPTSVADIRAETRAAGYATVDQKFIPGLVACAAPVLDWQDCAQCAITLIGIDPATIQPGSEQLKLLTEFCNDHSISGSTENNAPPKTTAPTTEKETT